MERTRAAHDAAKEANGGGLVADEWLNDEELLTRLHVLFAELDPVDPDALETARFALGWRTLDAELAELSYDSLTDRDVMAAVRDGGLAGTGPRLLGFDTDVSEDVESSLTVEVEVISDRSRSSLIGQLMPPAPATVSVLCSGRRRPVATVAADELGRFRVEELPVGPVRLRLETGGRTVDTSWVSYAALRRAS